MNRDFTEIEIQRRKKIAKLNSKKIEPYARNIKFSHNSQKIRDEFVKYSKPELEAMNKEVSIAFRIMTMRGPFLVGKDAFGKVQAYVDKKSSADIKLVREHLDVGDIIKVIGPVMKTNTGEVTIRVKKLILVTKALKQLPEKFHGLKDIEERYRRRYVDLIVNNEVKNIFWKRTKIITAIRDFFDKLNFMEADTPILSAINGGAAARPFKTYHNALKTSLHLRIATELHLKRLLVGGIEKVYEIGRLFRNEGIDASHNPEFTAIEFYESYSNLEGMMQRTEQLIMHISKVINQSEVEVNGKKVPLKVPFKRMEMTTEVSKAINLDLRKCTFEEAKAIALKHSIKIQPYFKIGHIINELFEELVEDKIFEPTFVYGHPIEVSPFAAKSQSNPKFTERAELFIGGREYANMFTELNDPLDQYERFISQLGEARAGNEETNELDIDFVEALEYGMPPAGGCGVGIDRLVMLFTGKTSIREVLLFPHLKEKIKKGIKHE